MLHHIVLTYISKMLADSANKWFNFQMLDMQEWEIILKVVVPVLVLPGL